MFDEKSSALTPEETEDTVSELAGRLEEMDRAAGVLGEAILDEELEDVAGGLIRPSPPPGKDYCVYCGAMYDIEEGHDCPFKGR